MPSKKKPKQDTILVVCAHSDDQIFGVGGTLAKYSKEGKNIKTIIFSYGENSHPWLKEKVTIQMRVKESYEADRVIGGGGVLFYNLKEGNFVEEVEKNNVKDKLKKIMNRSAVLVGIIIFYNSRSSHTLLAHSSKGRKCHISFDL